MAKGKGSQFEREFATELSNWWSEGESDSIFWRSTTSGARATVRGRKNKETSGQGGDIAATDPSGHDLMRFTSIELKRGYSDTTFADVLDKLPSSKPKTWEVLWQQALDGQRLNRSRWAWLVIRRDRRREILFSQFKMFQEAGIISPPIRFRYNGQVIGAIPLSDFFRLVTPDDIRNALYYVGVMAAASKKRKR